MSITTEIEYWQDRILDLAKRIEGNKYKDEVRHYRKKIREAEENIIILKSELETLKEIQRDDMKDFLDGTSSKE